MAVFERALALLHGGDPLAAEELCVAAVRTVEAREGRPSPAYSAAQFDLAQILVGCGDLLRAAEALRIACDLPTSDVQSTRDRLTYMMNLGEILARGGWLDEAEPVLREGVELRRGFYGDTHPGYAFGLEPLAELLLLRGEAQEAVTVSDDAVSILAQAGHPRAVEVLALRAHSGCAHGEAPADATAEARHLSDEALEAFVRACVGRGGRGDAAALLRLLQAVDEQLVERFGEDCELRVRVVAEITNAARAASDDRARIAAFRSLVDMLDAQGDEVQALDAVLGLAMAQGDAGYVEEAAASYERAMERAIRSHDEGTISQVARNYGLYLSEVGRVGEAAQLLADAVSRARRAARSEILGRALIAEGIFRQHEGELQAGKERLEAALRLLEPSHPDTLVARSHLRAIRNSGSCGCGDMSGALSDALQKLALPHLPPGLVENLELEVEEGGAPKLRVQLARPATDEEIERLDRVLHQAMTLLRQSMTQR